MISTHKSNASIAFVIGIILTACGGTEVPKDVGTIPIDLPSLVDTQGEDSSLPDEGSSLAPDISPQEDLPIILDDGMASNPDVQDAFDAKDVSDVIPGPLDIAPDIIEEDIVECGDTIPCPAPYVCDGPEAIDCDDENACTIDSCDAQEGCSNLPACPADDNLCTIETCIIDPLPLCASEPVECADDQLCTVDSCDPETGSCTYEESISNNPACNDGDLCTIDQCIELCVGGGPDDPEGGSCQQSCIHDPVVCINTELCTTNTCNPINGACLPGPANCDDGNDCTIDTCEEAVGCINEIFPCDDGNLCTFDICVPSDLPLEDLCVHAPIGMGVEECSDGDPCTDDFCNASTHECGHNVKMCIDGITCTEDSCDSLTGNCINDASEAGCDDMDPCTADACQGDGCTHTALVCDDGLECTTDTCNSFGDGCEYTAKICSNGNPCDGLETCNPVNGQCVNGSAISCNNGNACDGEETCDPNTGNCSSGDPTICNDFVSCMGEEYCNSVTGNCQISNQTGASCPVSGSKCNEDGLVSGPVGNLSTLGPTDKFWIFDDGKKDERYALIEQIKANSDVTAASYSTILDDLNRTGDKVSWVIGTQCYDWGYKFNSGDNWVEYWYPQGVSGTASAFPTGKVEGHSVTLVSWYHKPEEDSSTSENKGVRISFIRTTNSNSIKYRNILLVEPYEESYATGPVASFKPVAFHAGGMAWYKNLLYVADTSHGFRVFDMSKMMKVTIGSNSTIGCLPWNNNCQAYNYKYVLPMVARYRLETPECTASCCVRFAFAAMDLTTSPISILSGEYESGNKNGRLHRWPLDSETGWMLEENEIVHPTQVMYPNVKRMQGAVSVNNYFFISSSEPKTNWPQTPGSLYFTYEYGEPLTRGYPAFPEDLHYSSFSDRLWSCTEMPGLRYVFSVKRTHAIYGCD